MGIARREEDGMDPDKLVLGLLVAALVARLVGRLVVRYLDGRR